MGVLVVSLVVWPSSKLVGVLQLTAVLAFGWLVVLVWSLDEAAAAHVERPSWSTLVLRTTMRFVVVAIAFGLLAAFAWVLLKI
jgi:hypothetical protein